MDIASDESESRWQASQISTVASAIAAATDHAAAAARGEPRSRRNLQAATAAMSKAMRAESHDASAGATDRIGTSRRINWLAPPRIIGPVQLPQRRMTHLN